MSSTVILQINDNPKEDFQKLLRKIYHGEEISGNYYEMRHLCSFLQDTNLDLISEMILNVIAERINVYHCILKDNPLNVNVFMQIYRDYRSVIKKIYQIIDKFIPGLKENKKFSLTHKMGIFYDAILKSKDYNNTETIDLLTNHFDKIDFHNKIILQDAIEFVLIMYYFTIHKHHDKNYDHIMKKLISIPGFVKILCKYVHHMMINLDNSTSNNQYHDYIYPKIREKQTVKKICELVKILSEFSDQHIVCNFHRWYLQARIINPQYSHSRLMLELRLVYHYKQNPLCRKMKNMIYDIINSRNYNAIIITRSNWKLITMPTHLQINFPPEIKSLLASINEKVKWNPLIGIVTLKAHFRKPIAITCYMCQAVTLLYFNKQTDVTEKKLSQLSGLNPKLISKILDSFVSAGLILCSLSMYHINMDHNIGQMNIDLRPFFIEAFELDVDDKNI